MWAPLQVHSYFSLLSSPCEPERIASRCAELGYTAVAITDRGNVGGAVQFSQACRKEGIKPILGCQFSMMRHRVQEERDDPQKRLRDGRRHATLTVLARNRDGWKQLTRAVSRSHSKDYLYYEPRLHLEDLGELAAHTMIAIGGQPGSDLANAIFHDPATAYACESKAALQDRCLRTDAKKVLLRAVDRYIDVFGRDHVFLGVQASGADDLPARLAVTAYIRWLASKRKLPCVAVPDAYYAVRADAADQRVLLCSRHHTTMPDVVRRLQELGDPWTGAFFQHDAFHIPREKWLRTFHTDDELAHAVAVAEMCEDYDITSQPRMPTFDCPGQQDEASYLKELCQRGFQRLIRNRKDTLTRPIEEYQARMERELEVIIGAGLASYFLIVQDITGYGRERGWLQGPARGSAGGCLCSYLTGITLIDPLPYDLLFERFYNAGRNKPGHISLPDIDLDFPLKKRDRVVRYLQDKYGHDRVAKIATFNSLAGKSALDEVMRVHEVPFDERKVITAIMPDPARISDELQDMRERGEEPSVIQYSLEHFGDALSDWVQIGPDGKTLTGAYAPYFEQAKRLEGVKKNQSVHAAGVIIAPEPLDGICPLTYDESDNCLVAGMEYTKLESLGLMKLDLLRIAMLNKGEAVRSLCRTGEISDV